MRSWLLYVWHAAERETTMLGTFRADDHAGAIAEAKRRMAANGITGEPRARAANL